MFLRALLVISLVAFLSQSMAGTNDAPTLPTHNPSIAIPLLKKISANDKEQLTQILKILGKPFVRVTFVQVEHAFYIMDDGSYIMVMSSWPASPPSKLESISIAPAKNGSWKTIWPNQKN